ncbi:phosphoribosylglycinamide formyltransferase [Reichenbachiella versicolor]|uniref:phosphoribosylglycinamide formyltransferase n=1 Tax=Reichenbachiella versicolor TaxID=1821036 RepID=UPI000D6E7C35|nr:phosphoribosylglycinamide formyltransferase [Reichenbachiella versicolor]
MVKKRLAIFASGSGSNAEAIANYFNGHNEIEITMILSDKPKAYVHTRAKKLRIPSWSFNRQEFYESEDVKNKLANNKIDYIVLAGFMWLVPEYLVKSYPNKIFNIHPALLPKYGGKGMYGHHVHEAVIDAREKESGITIHLVNEEYDKGKVLCQKSLEVSNNDTPDSLADKIHKLEHEFYPRTIESFICK